MIKAKYQIPRRRGQVLPLHFAHIYAVHMFVDGSGFRILCYLKGRPFECSVGGRKLQTLFLSWCL